MFYYIYILMIHRITCDLVLKACKLWINDTESIDWADNRMNQRTIERLARVCIMTSVYSKYITDMTDHVSLEMLAFS